MAPNLAISLVICVLLLAVYGLYILHQQRLEEKKQSLRVLKFGVTNAAFGGMLIIVAGVTTFIIYHGINSSEGIFFFAFSFLFFLLGAASVVSTVKTSVVYSDVLLQEQGLFRLKNEVLWTHVKSVHFGHLSHSLVFKDGVDDARVSLYLSGIEDFINHARQHLPRELYEKAFRQAVCALRRYHGKSIQNDDLTVARYTREQVKKYYLGEIKNGIILALTGPSLSVLFYYLNSEDSDLLSKGYIHISLIGVIYIVTSAVRWMMLGYDENDTTEHTIINEPASYAVGLQHVLLAITISLTILFGYVSAKEVFVEQKEIIYATTTKSLIIDTWQDTGYETKRVLFAMPGIPELEYDTYRESTATSTQAIEYYFLSEGNDAFNVDVEYVVSDTGERLFTPDIQREITRAYEWFVKDDTGNIMQGTTSVMTKIPATLYTITRGDQKLAGVFFEHEGLFFDVYVWPEVAANADAHLEQLLSTFRFTNEQIKEQ